MSILKTKLVKWLKEQLGDSTAVIGISGGKDSSVVAALCVEAVGKDKVLGVLMPNGEQKDIMDATLLVEHLGIKSVLYNIEHVMTAFNEGFRKTQDFKRPIDNYCYKTNTPARIRMTVLYGFAAMIGNARVMNTSNASEAFVGYCTKWGDNVGDLFPLINLTVEEVVSLGKELGLPDRLVNKAPSDGMSGKPDETILGFSYKNVDRCIEMKFDKVDKEIKDKIAEKAVAAQHKWFLMERGEAMFKWDR